MTSKKGKAGLTHHSTHTQKNLFKKTKVRSSNFFKCGVLLMPIITNTEKEKKHY